MNTVKLPDKTAYPQLGLGTWHIGDNPLTHQQEVSALRLGIELGMTLIDTAEMYGEGKSETLVGEAISVFPRNSLTLVSKVYPHNAGKNNIFQSCEHSLRRLQTDYLDLYLLHWRGGVPLSETVYCMQQLKKEGKIKNWGVSNFDLLDMQELFQVPDGDRCAVNQVLYHLGSRGIEFDLLPWMKEHNIPVMAYCPLAQAGSLKRALLQDSTVKTIAQKHHATTIQILLAFVLSHNTMIAIPKSKNQEHIKQNALAAQISLDEQDLASLNRAFPAPHRKVPLDIE